MYLIQITLKGLVPYASIGGKKVRVRTEAQVVVQGGRPDWGHRVKAGSEKIKIGYKNKGGDRRIKVSEMILLLISMITRMMNTITVSNSRDNSRYDDGYHD